MANGDVDLDDDSLPLAEEELEAMALRATVALSSPPGTPDPRPRRDTLEEAYDSVLRLVREVRRLRRRDARTREALRTAAATGEPDRLRSAIEDVLDDTV
jgi:hypothetical protein